MAGIRSRLGKAQVAFLTVKQFEIGDRLSFPAVIREIDIWRVAVLMVNRYADEAKANSDRRAAELATDGDPGSVLGLGERAASLLLRLSPWPTAAAGLRQRRKPRPRTSRQR
jgi:hypothetical protein